MKPRRLHDRSRPRTVALLVETSNDYARGLLRGVVAYIRKHRPWTTYFAEHGRGDVPPTWLRKWRGDGILARIENRRIANAVVATRCPIVDLSAANLVPGVPWVETDDRAIASLAFEHLRDRGLRQFAFLGDGRFNWSNWRQAEFGRLCQRQGWDCEVLNAASLQAGSTWAVQLRRTIDWVRRLAKPVGIMAAYDTLGRQLLEACRIAGVAVPDNAAVVGVDDDELLCELSEPPLSSVASDPFTTGYQAAELLDGLMNGQQVKPVAHLIAPLGIVVRRSSDMVAIADQDVAAALRFIRERACEGINVSDVLLEVPVSRRVLEARFARQVGRTPHGEIERVRLLRARELLWQTDLSLSAIADRTGFRHAEYLSVVFKRNFGIPPGRSRRQHARR